LSTNLFIEKQIRADNNASNYIPKRFILAETEKGKETNIYSLILISDVLMTKYQHCNYDTHR